MSIRTQVLQTNFTAGELSPQLEGRTDLAKYFNAAKTIENFYVLPYGGAKRRAGSRFVAETKYSAKKSRLMSFQFSTTQAYIIEIGDFYMRFYKDRGVIVKTTGDTDAWLTATNYVLGDFVKQAGVIYYCVTAHTSGVFATDLAAVKWVAQSTYEIPTNYTEDQLAVLQFSQSGDVLYITHPDHPPAKLSRFGHADWVLSDVEFTDGPFLDDNISNVSMDTSAATGSGVTVNLTCPAWGSATDYHIGDYVTNGGSTYKCNHAHTSSGSFATDAAYWDLKASGIDIFEAGHVGALFKKQNTTTIGYLRLTAVTNGYTATADVVVTVVTTAAKTWAEGAFSGVRGYPAAVTFFEQRLYYGGTTFQPQTIFASVIADFDSFAVSDPIVDDDALSYTLYSEQVNVIRWMVAGKLLFIGTSGGYFTVQSGSSADSITPTNIVVRRESTFGAAQIVGEKIGNALYFVQYFGRKVREINYQYLTDGYIATDMTIIADQVTESGIVEIDYQMVPFSILWAIRNDGQMALMTRESEQEVTAWYRFATQGQYKSVSIIPGVAEDEPWVIVQRTVNGSSKKYVEFFEAHDWGTDQDDCFFVDSGLTYDGAAATVMSGLGHLEGLEVQVLADGAEHPNKTVSGGSITLERSASVVQIGLPFTSTLVTCRPELGDTKQTSQGKLKRIVKIWGRLYKSLGFKAGSEAKQDSVVFRKPSDLMDNQIPLFTGDKDLINPSGFDADARIKVVQDLPMPLTVSAIAALITIHDA